MRTSDHELMDRCRTGDAEAFRALVVRWEEKVARLARRLGGSGVDVEGVCQETFLRVLKARARYQPLGSFSTWLYSIALNVARDAARRERRRGAGIERLTEPAEMGPEQKASQDEIGELVRGAVSKLPSDLREVVVLKHYGEMTFAEVGEVLGLPTSTVKSRMRVGLDRLRNTLKQLGVHEEELES